MGEDFGRLVVLSKLRVVCGGQTVAGFAVCFVAFAWGRQPRAPLCFVCFVGGLHDNGQAGARRGGASSFADADGTVRSSGICGIRAAVGGVASVLHGRDRPRQRRMRQWSAAGSRSGSVECVVAFPALRWLPVGSRSA